MLHAVAQVGVLAVAASSGGCSLVLDWDGYTGGDESVADGAPDGPPTSDAAPEAAPCSTTCRGCCDAKGACASGTTADACGTAGRACADCSASGRTCLAGSCATPPPVDSGPVDSGPTCTDDGCRAMAYSCGQVPFYTPKPCCQSNGTCGCTPDPTGGSTIACGPRF